MRVAIHQPEYMPCLALLSKVAQADILVVLDDVQFNRSSLQHRTWVADQEGRGRWMTIPFVHKFPQEIKDVKVADANWVRSHLGILHQLYRKAPKYKSLMKRLVLTENTRIAEIAEDSMNFMLDLFGLTPKIIRSSAQSWQTPEDKSARVLHICKSLDAHCYVSGRAGAKYLDTAAFAEVGVEIRTTRFEVPQYRSVEKIDRISGLDAAMWVDDPSSLLESL